MRHQDVGDRLLVTGGSGYLGRWVVQLARARWQVSATYLSTPVDESYADWYRLDVGNRAAVEGLMAQVCPTVVVHAAAVNPGGGTDFEAVNVTGTRHVARAAADMGARLIHLSSDVVFDGAKGNYAEADTPTPVTPYGRSKALAEEEVQASGAEAIIVRTSLIYGWRPRTDRHTRWVADDLKAGVAVRLYIDELRCPVWVESLAAAVVELATTDHTGVLHVAGAQALSRYDFGVRLMHFHGRDPGPIVPVRRTKLGLPGPIDGTLDCSRARALLRTPLPGVDEVLEQRPLTLPRYALE